MMAHTSLASYTVREIVDRFALTYLAELKDFYTSLKSNPTHDDTQLQYPIGIQEFNYHYGSAGKETKKKKTKSTSASATDSGYDMADLASIRLNNLFPDYKILCDRTQDYLYERALDILAENDPEWLTVDLATHLTTKRLDQMIKWLVFTHPTVEDFMRPIVDRFQTFAQDKIDRIDNIPGPAQKSPEWFAARQNAISASTCGYSDSVACRIELHHETGQVKEKAEIGPKKTFNSASFPLKHGTTFEALTENYYSTIRGYTVGEYGLIIEPTAKHIGASPDGIVLNTNSQSYLHRKRHARMLEIKNPVSRAIDRTVPSYYYWQMLQQMYVCQIPFCDFVQTQFQYPNEGNWDDFIEDTLDFTGGIAACTEWQQLYNHLAPYIMDTACDYRRLIEVYECDHGTGAIMDLAITGLGPAMVSYFLDPANFEYITNTPPCNINKRGQIKGILRTYMKGNYDEVDSRFIPFGIPITDKGEVDAQIKKWDTEMATSGFVPEKTNYWSLVQYLLTEVEYNAELYYNGTDDCIFARLTRLWDFILELRAITDPEARLARFHQKYPESSDKGGKNYTYSKKQKNVSDVTFDLDTLGVST